MKSTIKNRSLLILLLLIPVILGIVFDEGLSAQPPSPIRLGCPLPLGFVYGRAAERGIRLAMEEINAGGGVNVDGVKHPLAMKVMDTRDLEPGIPVSDALLAVERLILEKRVDFLVGGPLRSEAALAAMDLVGRHNKISILTAGALTPKYHARIAETYPRYKTCFRITGEAGWMVRGEIIPFLLEIEKKHGLNRVAVMVQDVAHARAGGELIAKLLQEKGWVLTGPPEVYPTGTTDFSMGLLKAKRQKAQIILIWMDMPETAILLKQLHDLKIPALPLGASMAAAEQPGFWQATEGKGEYALVSLVNAANAPSRATPWTMKFYQAYTRRWKVEPECYGASSSYMGVYVLKEAIEKAGSLETEAVVAALEQTDLMGVYGRIRFDPRSHQIIPSLDPREGAVGTIFQWQNGKRVAVFPFSIAAGEVRLQPGLTRR
jgi:branched-chain amino acid transport system substrate-binding protein